LLLLCDIFSVFFSYFLASLIQFGTIGAAQQAGQALLYLPWLSLLFCGLFFTMKLYHSLWRYSGISEAIRILICIALGMSAFLLCNYFFNLGISHIVIAFFGFILTLMVGASRFGYRMVRYIVIRKKGTGVDLKKKPVLLIVGAGSSGAVLISRFQSEKAAYRDIVLADDDENKQNMWIHGVCVAGKVCDIPRIVEQRKITDIIIAIPSLSRIRLSEIFEVCRLTGCRVRMMPLLRDIDNEENLSRQVREVDISDVLFRSEADLDIESIGSYLQGKNVLVTGGGGSIGSEICRQVARFPVQSLTIFDIYENTAYELLCELKEKYGDSLNVRVEVGSIREKMRMQEVFEACRPHIVFHSAAHKHVPLMEKSPLEAIKNNVGGTLNVLEAANAAKVERFVQLSTDKAVNPTNIMGATKRVAELMVQSYARKTRMKCMTVRFGNVIGSHGSVIPLMERQIKNGGPITLTHTEITRYFMTIPEAAQLVLQAGGLADSGAIYVLNMGEPVKIADLAKKLIRFHGYEPDIDIPIKVIGLRPGEKMHEELLMPEEKSVKTMYGQIYRVRPMAFDMDRLDKQITRMLILAQLCDLGAIGRLKAIVPNYNAGFPVGEEQEEINELKTQVEY
jgi:FlaA1/EpsC-like NDP-sugar epimerase